MRRLLHPWLIRGVLLLSIVGSAQAMRELISVNDINAGIEAPEQINVTPSTPIELIFAKAHRLEKKDPIEAIRLYGEIASKAPPALLARIRYNLGSLYLNDAARVWKKSGLSEYIRINTLLGAAKDNLRESLTLDPSNWEARFNLEYAERITPPPKERPKNDFQGNKGSVFATLPAIPGGGP